MRNTSIVIILTAMLWSMNSTFAFESMVRPVQLVPQARGIAIEKSAEYSVIKSLPSHFLSIQATLILHYATQVGEEKCTASAWEIAMSDEKTRKKLRKSRKEYIQKNGGYSSVTFAEGNLYAIEKEYGLDKYLVAKYQYVEKMRMNYDFSLIAVSIDNNVPVVLKSGDGVFVCLGYDDKDIVTADISKVKGIRTLPGFYMELSELRKKEKLTAEEKARREEYETALRTGNYHSDFDAPVFAPESLGAIYPHSFLVSFPREEFKGEMILFGSPKPDVSKL